MKKVFCTVVEHQDNELVGLLPDNLKEWFNKGKYQPGFRLSHELLEHGNKETGSMADELKAHGVRLWVNNFYSAFPYNPYSLPEETYARDLADCVSDAFELEGFSYPRIEKKSFRKFDELETLESFFDDAWKHLERKLCTNDYLLLSEHEENPEAEVLEYLASIKEVVFSHVAAGYSHAEKVRYKNYDNYNVFLFGERMDKEIERIGKIAEIGDVVILRYSLKESFVKAEIDYREFY